ncbi:MAG TPA: dTDP-4-dehydrorhamnose reductase [Holophagaceae bacterium]|nr:dTDP-4-dehydrorhamnose reductase [Holophagaceae bacterium]
MSVLVTGGGGQLARAIAATWIGEDVLLLDRHALDIGQPGAAMEVLRAHSPSVVINAGAHTQVDLCESEPERAQLLNATAVRWLAEACDAQGALLVQISTDYVFDGLGTRPYREGDPTGPRSVYGRTKLQGEQEAAKAAEHLIVRSSWLYEVWGRNFYNTMLDMAAKGRALRVVDDQRGAPTSCRALARQLHAAVEEGWRGTVHATCGGEATWFQFAQAIFQASGIAADLSPCATSEFPRPATRPAYSVLSGEKRRSLGHDVMPDWREALAEVAAAGAES